MLCPSRFKWLQLIDSMMGIYLSSLQFTPMLSNYPPGFSTRELNIQEYENNNEFDPDLFEDRDQFDPDFFLNEEIEKDREKYREENESIIL